MALTSTAIRAVRRRFGDRAEDVMDLRAAGRTVAPYGDGFRVDREIVDADGLEGLANELRARKAAWAKRRTKKPAPETPGGGAVAVETMKGDNEGRPGASAINSDAASAGCEDVSDVPPATNPQTDDADRASVTPASKSGIEAGPNCPCGRPRGHGGRCWWKRREQSPRVCEKCGGPRSKKSAALCLACYKESCGGGERRPAKDGNTTGSIPGEDRRSSPSVLVGAIVRGAAIQPCAGVAPGPQDTLHVRVNALESEVAALKAELAAYKRTVKAAVEDLVVMLGADR